MEELGRGGFGVVYKAWQADLERVVALKFLHSDSQESSERFVREAKIAANLSHPNITAIYEVGEHEGKLYITMQFVDGTTTNKTKFTVREAAQTVREAALAVDYAHARDVVHRDIKPHNIMVTQEKSGTSPSETARRTFVMDFGLARIASRGNTLTTEGQIMGTPAYMAPEQAEGRTCDARSDVYSLAATLYTLVTERAPFEANTPVQVLMKVTQGSPVPPSQINPQVDPNLEAIILKAMEVKPENRYPSASRLAADLGRWLQGEAPDAGKTIQIGSGRTRATAGTVLRHPTAPTVEAPRNSRGGLFAAVIAVLVAAGGVAAWIKVQQPPPDFTAISARTSPPGALLAVEGVTRTWTTPAEILASELNGSPAKVTLSLAGHKSIELRADFSGSRRVVLNEKLLPEENPPPPPPSFHEVLEIRSEPPGAEVVIPGIDRFTTPVTLNSRDLKPGTYTVEFSKAGYQAEKADVTIREGAAKETLERKLKPAARAEAFVITSQPPGAKVLLYGKDAGGVTPFLVYRDQVREGVLQFDLELAGHQGQTRSFPLGEQLQKPPPILLEPLTGRLVVRGAAPRSTILVFALPAGVKNVPALLGLWSENGESLEAALDKLAPDDAKLAVDRLRELSKRPEPKLREKAAKLAAAAPTPVQVKPEHALQAGADGTATLGSAAVTRTYRLLGTSSSTMDYVSDDLRPDPLQERIVRADMTVLAMVAVKTRPALGHFTLLLADGTAVGQLLPNGPPLKAPAGPLLLRYSPAANAPVLKEFTLPIQAGERFELTGNIHLHFAQAAERERDTESAVRGYTKVLEEPDYPGSEEAERSKLPERIRILYRGWVDAAEKDGKAIPGDLLQYVRDSWKRVAHEAIPLLVEAYAAKNGTAQVRTSAASSLAHMHAKMKRPYEAVEWLERMVKDKVVPAAEVEGAVITAARGYPGLPERLETVTQALLPLRRPPPPVEKMPGFLGAIGSEAGGKGVRIDALAKGYPAEGAGLRLGDLITDVGGTPVRTSADLAATERDAGAGLEVAIKFERAGEAKTVTLKLAAKPVAEPEYLKAPERLGTLHDIHVKYGIFVKLDAEGTVSPGDVLEAVRNGEAVAEIVVDTVGKPEPKYPAGSAVCKPLKGTAQKGDDVRRLKK